MDDETGPDRSAAAEDLGDSETSYHGSGEDVVDPMHEGEDHSADRSEDAAGIFPDSR